MAEQHLEKVEPFSNLHKVSISARSGAVNKSQGGVRREDEKEWQGASESGLDILFVVAFTADFILLEGALLL